MEELLHLSEELSKLLQSNVEALNPGKSCKGWFTLDWMFVEIGSLELNTFS